MSILSSLNTILQFVLGIYSWFILARVILSWVNPDPYNPVVNFLFRATEPVLAPLRRLIPGMGGMDFSPILAYFGIIFLEQLFNSLLQPGAGALLILLGQALQLLHLLGTFYLLILIIRGGVHLHSWYSFRYRRPSNLLRQQPWVRFVFQVTEPLLRPMRRWVPTVYGLDISPIVAMLFIFVALLILQKIILIISIPAALL
ncbi:MAG: YggT family protein [Magnetococcus sp. DMHC-6]